MDYKRVIEDFKSGKLSSKYVTLVMDNDDGFFYCKFPELTEEENDNLQDELERKYGRSEGYRDIVNILNAAGVPCEWC